MFLAQGFDAASMGEIARQAGVSKGTLYVYFDSKEALFEAIVEEERRAQAEQVFALDSNDHDVEAVLTRLGGAFVRFLCQPEALSPLRTVIAIAERMPELGSNSTRPAPRPALRGSPLSGRPGRRQACSRSPTAKWRRRSSSTPASRRCSSRCCSTPAGRRPKSGSSHVVGIAVRTFLSAYAPR